MVYAQPESILENETLKIEETYCHSDSSEKPPALIGVKNSEKKKW